MTKLIVQIPCFNEEATLAETIADIPRTIDGVDRIEILVIDDGSTDDSVHIVETFQRSHPSLRLIRHEANRGALAAGNVMASAMGMTYGGAGGTLGPGMVFGFAAGRHAAQRI